MAELITSRIEWAASLDPTKAQVPTEETKYHRKVCPIRATVDLFAFPPQPLTSNICAYNRRPSSQPLVRYLSHKRREPVFECVGIPGPNVNNVEKLTELRRAGVNIGVSFSWPAYPRVLNGIYARIQPHSLPVRMNFSHGEYEYHQSVIDNTRKMVSRMSSFLGVSETRMFICL